MPAEPLDPTCDAWTRWTRDEVLAAVRRLREASATARECTHEGLRERKKRMTREQISDIATWMFCERGFDAVRIAEVAAEAGVSEKTIYNYFPTKESLVLDRAEELADELRTALRRRPAGSSPTVAVVGMLEHELEHYVLADELVQPMMLAFGRLVQTTPALLAALRALVAGLVDVAAEELAREAGVDPHDPEPQVAARALVALWDVHVDSRRRRLLAGLSGARLRTALLDDLHRAAAIVDDGIAGWRPSVDSSTPTQS